MTIRKTIRCYRYSGLLLPDPAPDLDVESVRSFYAASYPEITTAALTGPEAVDGTLVYTFTRAIEIRGASAFFRRRSLSRLLRLNAGFSGTRRRSHFSVELRIWLARICFQNRQSRWIG